MTNTTGKVGLRHFLAAIGMMLMGVGLTAWALLSRDRFGRADNAWIFGVVMGVLVIVTFGYALIVGIRNLRR